MRNSYTLLLNYQIVEMEIWSYIQRVLFLGSEMYSANACYTLSLNK